MDYVVRTGLRGKKTVEWKCIRCGEELSCPLGQAGTTCSCIKCETEQSVPGTEELKTHKTIEAGKVTASTNAAILKAQQKREEDRIAAENKVFAENAKAAELPKYESIVKGAGLLHRSADAYAIIGYFVVFISIAIMIGGAIFIYFNNVDYAIATIFTGLIGLLIAVVAFNWAKLLRLFAELSLAARDIALNSFKK
jgi:hypothetical protein